MQNDRWRYCWGSPIDAINLWGIACLYCSQCIVLTDSGRCSDISLSGYMIKDLMKCVISPCVYKITQKLRKTGSKLRNSNSGVLTWFTWLMPSCFLCSFVVVSSLGCNGWSVSEGIILKGYTDYNNVGVKDMFFSHCSPQGSKIGSGRKMIILVHLRLFDLLLLQCIFLITGSQKIMNLSLFQKQYTSVKGQSHLLIKVKDKIEKKNGMLH